MVRKKDSGERDRSANYGVKSGTRKVNRGQNNYEGVRQDRCGDWQTKRETGGRCEEDGLA